MKILFFALFIFTLTGCGLKKTTDNLADSIGRGMGQALSCMTSTAFNSMFTPVITIRQDNIDRILLDLQGRTFSRNTFWTLLSRKTRIALNLTLNEQLRVPEEILYPGFVLFIENHLKNPGQNYYLKTASHQVRFVIDAEETRINQTECENQDEALKKIDVSKVVPASSLEERITCRMDNGGSFSLSFYTNHILISNGEQNLFSRGEVIRTETENDLKITALDPDEQTLEMVLAKKSNNHGERNLQINFAGKTQTLSGSYFCSTQN